MLKMEVENNTKQIYSIIVFKHNFIVAFLWSYISIIKQVQPLLVDLLKCWFVW